MSIFSLILDCCWLEDVGVDGLGVVARLLGAVDGVGALASVSAGGDALGGDHFFAGLTAGVVYLRRPVSQRTFLTQLLRFQ